MHGVFNHGIYQITTALNPPTLSFADEQFPQFEVTAYSSTTRYNNYSATQLKAGYWDQNSRIGRSCRGTAERITPRHGTR